jgi:hypothetical protein
MLRRYSTEEEAAEAHDVAALKCHGLKAKTNFHLSRCGAPARRRAARGQRQPCLRLPPTTYDPMGPPWVPRSVPQGVRPAHAPVLDHPDHVNISAP